MLSSIVFLHPGRTRPSVGLLHLNSSRAPPANYEQNQSADADHDADHLRSRKPRQSRQAKDVTARIVAHKLDQKSHRRINDRVSEDYLATKRLSLVQPQQE